MKPNKIGRLAYQSPTVKSALSREKMKTRRDHHQKNKIRRKETYPIKSGHSKSLYIPYNSYTKANQENGENNSFNRTLQIVQNLLPNENSIFLGKSNPSILHVPRPMSKPNYANNLFYGLRFGCGAARTVIEARRKQNYC